MLLLVLNSPDGRAGMDHCSRMPRRAGPALIVGSRELWGD
jgi:hypothetical protein